jgi:hypothetical protein
MLNRWDDYLVTWLGNVVHAEKQDITPETALKKQTKKKSPSVNLACPNPRSFILQEPPDTCVPLNLKSGLRNISEMISLAPYLFVQIVSKSMRNIITNPFQKENLWRIQNEK